MYSDSSVLRCPSQFDVVAMSCLLISTVRETLASSRLPGRILTCSRKLLDSYNCCKSSASKGTTSRKMMESCPLASCTKNESVAAISFRGAPGLSEGDLTGKSEQPRIFGVQSASWPLRILSTDWEACRRRSLRRESSGELGLTDLWADENSLSSSAIVPGGASLRRSWSLKNTFKLWYCSSRAGLSLKYGGAFQTTSVERCHFPSRRTSGFWLNAAL